MAEFNLIDEPWIPCIDRDNRNVEHGIRDTLVKAHRLREICDDSPLVTVAIHRLLLAVLYRAFEGPRNYATWKNLYSCGVFDTKTVGRYLDKWKDGFDLFGDDKPFYQMARFETDKPISVNRLATQFASGNNATLFDHCGDGVEVERTPSQAAKYLIACQAFASGGGKCSKAKILSSQEPRPNFADAPALRGMNIWLQGSSVFDTLAINLVPVEDSSYAPWELDEPQQQRDDRGGKKQCAVAAMGVVDRLTWQSRLVRLVLNGRTVSRMYFTQGRSADKSAGDPMKVYRASKEEGVSPLSLRSGKAAWRDAHSILVIPTAGSNERRPECFNLADRAAAGTHVSKPFVAQVVGMASAPNKAAKFLLWRHERMPIPATLLSDVNLIERLGVLLQHAEQGGRELNMRARRIAKLYLSPECESPTGRQPDADEVTKVADAIDPRPAYWARLEKHFFWLLENLSDDWDKANNEWKPDDQQKASRTWREDIKREAKRSLEESIRSLGTTARAIQAVARVRTDFTDDDLIPLPQKVNKTKAKGGKRK